MLDGDSCREGGEGKAKEGKERLFRLSGRVIGSAMRVHTQLGPGLLEAAYEACLCRALSTDGLRFEKEHPVPLHFEGLNLDCGYRLDLLVEGCLVVEIKAVAKLLPVHISQLRTYLKLSGHSCGLLINFNTRHLREGIRQLHTGYPSHPSPPSPPSA